MDCDPPFTRGSSVEQADTQGVCVHCVYILVQRLGTEEKHTQHILRAHDKHHVVKTPGRGDKTWTVLWGGALVVVGIYHRNPPSPPQGEKGRHQTSSRSVYMSLQPQAFKPRTLRSHVTLKETQSSKRVLIDTPKSVWSPSLYRSQ